MQKMGGTEALEQPYLEIPLFKLFQKRIVWLVVLFIGEMLTATAMGYFIRLTGYCRSSSLPCVATRTGDSERNLNSLAQQTIMSMSADDSHAKRMNPGAMTRDIRQNLVFHLCLQCLGVPMAAGALYPFLGSRSAPSSLVPT